MKLRVYEIIYICLQYIPAYFNPIHVIVSQMKSRCYLSPSETYTNVGAVFQNTRIVILESDSTIFDSLKSNHEQLHHYYKTKSKHKYKASYHSVSIAQTEQPSKLQTRTTRATMASNGKATVLQAQSPEYFFKVIIPSSLEAKKVVSSFLLVISCLYKITSCFGFKVDELKKT